MQNNPFLETDFHIRWSALRPELIEPAMQTLLTEAQAAVDRIAAQPVDAVTYESTFMALEHATEALGVAWGKVTHLQAVADTPDLRAAHNKVLPRITAFTAGIPLNTELWRRLKAFAEKPAAAGLTAIQRRFLRETVADFRQAGADLPAAGRQRLEALQSELAELTQKFSENVLDATNAWELVLTDETRLAGLPEHAKAAAQSGAEAKGKGTREAPAWRFTLHMPSQEPFMTYLEDAGLRRQMWEAAAGVGRRAPHDNAPLIRRILALRAEKAALLGKADFADLVLERRMAKSGGKALEFMDDLRRRAAGPFAAEARALEAFRAAQTQSAARHLAPWETAFWAERLRRDQYAFDEEQLRPYFPMNRVIEGLFALVNRLYGLRVVAHAAGDVEVWHPEVIFYDLLDQGGRHLGSFYADWYPRESKRGGAWMNYLITGGPQADGSRQPHLGLICGNMTPPSGDQPALLTHREVETIFHEFGHLLHHLLGEVEIKSLNGVNVTWDFVELPSQIMENWCWERACLDLFARHHATGAPIPDDLFKKMTAARNFRSASAVMRQVAFAKMDLLLHRNTAAWEAAPDLEAAMEAELKDCLPPTEPPTPTIMHRFTHIFSDPVGYAAGYYSYKWAEVLEADAFTRFKREGIFNAQTGREFRERILSRGNSADPAELFRAFMGRDPNPEALLRRCGLLSASAA